MTMTITMTTTKYKVPNIGYIFEILLTQACQKLYLKHSRYLTLVILFTLATVVTVVTLVTLVTQYQWDLDIVIFLGAYFMHKGDTLKVNANWGWKGLAVKTFKS